MIILTKFMMVDIPIGYNTIVGRPTLYKLMAVELTYHLAMKFLMRVDIEELKSPRESHSAT